MMPKITIFSKAMALAAFFLVAANLYSTQSVQAKESSEKTTAVSSAINWKSLDLSPEQIKKINLLRLEFNKKAIRLKADAQLKQVEIQTQLMSPAANPHLVRKLLQEKLALESRLQAESLDHFLAIRKLLTPEQLVKLPQAVSLK
jgi:Spy/CpxP family protein refolding chaperone